MEYVVERFHGRSLALAHSQEEIEELDLRNNDDTLTEEKFVYLIYRISHSKKKIQFSSKLIRHNTYRVRKHRIIPSILQQDETIQSLTQSTIKKQRLIDQAARKVKEAESKAQDLSINIQ
jgi:hypothetical protein